MPATRWYFEGAGAKRHIGFAKSRLRVLRRSGRTINQWFNIAGVRIRIAITTSGLEEVWIFARADVHLLYDKDMRLGVANRLPLDITSLLLHPAATETNDPEPGYNFSEDVEVLRYLTNITSASASTETITLSAGFHTTAEVLALGDLPPFEANHPNKLSLPQILEPSALDTQLDRLIENGNHAGAYELFKRYISEQFSLSILSTTFVSLGGQNVAGTRLVFAKLIDGTTWFGVAGFMAEGQTFRGQTVGTVISTFLKVIDATNVVASGSFTEGVNLFLFYLPDLINKPSGVLDTDFIKESELDPETVTETGIFGDNDFFNESTDQWQAIDAAVTPSDGSNDFGFAFVLRSTPRLKGIHVLTANQDGSGFQPIDDDSNARMIGGGNTVFDGLVGNFGNTFFGENTEFNAISPWGGADNPTREDLNGQIHQRLETKYKLNLNFDAVNKTLSTSTTINPSRIVSVSGSGRFLMGDSGEFPQFITSYTPDQTDAFTNTPRTISTFTEAGIQTIGTAVTQAARTLTDPLTTMLRTATRGFRIPEVATGLRQVFSDADVTSFDSSLSVLSTIVNHNDDQLDEVHICLPYNTHFVRRESSFGVEYLEVWREGALIYTSPIGTDTVPPTSSHQIDQIPQNPRLSTFILTTSNAGVEAEGGGGQNTLDAAWSGEQDYLPGWNAEISLNGVTNQVVRFYSRPPASSISFVNTSVSTTIPMTVITHLTRPDDLCILVWEFGLNLPGVPAIAFNNFASQELIDFFQNDPYRPMYGDYILT